MMNIASLNAAIDEAERFLERARHLIQLQEQSPAYGLSAHRAASGAVRRASMELTRALTELRRPDA